MADAVLNDKNVYPSEDVIFSHIGKSAGLWVSFFDYLHKKHPDFTREWRYYNDGKVWLLKVQRKAKTVFWLSLTEGTFRTTFYFPTRAEAVIMGSSLSPELKESFAKRNRDLKNHGLSVWFRKKSDAEQAKLLCDLKLSIR